MDNQFRHQSTSQLAELQILEDLERAEALKQPLLFMGVGTDTGLYKPPLNEYLKKLFPDDPLTKEDIATVCEKENLGRYYLFSFVDGSKLKSDDE